MVRESELTQLLLSELGRLAPEGLWTIAQISYPPIRFPGKGIVRPTIGYDVPQVRESTTNRLFRSA